MSYLMWIGRDARYAVRSLLRDRASVGLAVLALSLAIGATTVIFSVVDSVFINAFPFQDQSRVVHFFLRVGDRPGGSAYYLAPDFAEYRAQNTVFSKVLGGRSLEVLYTRDSATYRTRGAHLDTEALRTLGVVPILGRDMAEADGAPDAPPTFLMSERLWSAEFNRDSKIIGTTMKLNGVFRTLIAVLPMRFLLHGADVFFPTTFTPDLTEALVGGPPNRPLQVWTYARLKPGVTNEQAAANIAVIAQNIARVHPDRFPAGAQLAATVESLADAYTATSVKEMVYILAGAVLMLLMIGCSNVANLLLARATAHEGELALRAGLGASRGRLMQQVLAESFVLAAAGTTIGAALAYLGLQWVRAAIPVNGLPSEMQIRFSGGALLATVGVAMLTTLLCGFAPALRAARGDLRDRLTGAGRGAGRGSARSSVRWLLVAIQVTLALVLLVGAGLLMRTLIAIQNIDPGFETHNVVVAQFGFPIGRTRTPTEQALFTQRVVERARALPGVAAVSPSVGVPLLGAPSSPVTILGTTLPDRTTTGLQFVGEQYFEIVNLPLVSGRIVTQADVDGARRVAVVNRAFGRLFLGGADPIGRMATFAALNRGADSGAADPFEIVGVVGDMRSPADPGEMARAHVYVPYTVSPFGANTILLRTRVDPRTVPDALRREVQAIDPEVALLNVGGTRGSNVLDAVLQRNAFDAPEFGVGLLGSFAVIGLTLSAIGVFSVMAYTVSLQTRDIGIRMALGAEPAGVMRMIVLRGLRPIVVGVIGGIGTSYGLSRFLASHLYGVTPTDPWTFATVVAMLLAVGIAACVLPARKAMRVDPLIALRAE
jgi:putative ABC transport system permease protein